MKCIIDKENYDRIKTGGACLGYNGTDICYKDAIRLYLGFNGSSYYLYAAFDYTDIGKIRVKKVNKDNCIEIIPYSNEYNKITLIPDNYSEVMQAAVNKINSMSKDEIIDLIHDPDIFGNITLKINVDGSYYAADIYLNAYEYIDTEKNNFYFKSTDGNFTGQLAVNSEVIEHINDELSEYVKQM